MRITERGTVYSGKDTPKYSSCSFPSICKLSNGTLIASFRGAARKTPDNATDRGCTLFSYDKGKTWTDPVELFDPPVVDGKKTTLRTIYYCEVGKNDLLCVFNAVDATLEDLPYYNEKTEGLKETYIMFSHSHDNGKTWDKPKRIQVGKFYDCPLPLTGVPIITPSGRICIQFEVNKHYFDEKYWVHHSCAVFSDDGGYSWGNETVITDSKTVYFWDQRISAVSDGRICDVFWTFDRDKGDYVNIHYAESKDDGKTFGQPVDTGLVGQPGNVIEGKDGSLLLIYIDRTVSPVIRIAKKTGDSPWKVVLTVFDFVSRDFKKKNAGMNDVWREMGNFNIGHPFITRIGEDELMAYFYCGPSTNRTDFLYVKIKE